MAETAWLHARSGPPRGAPRFSQRLGSCCVDSPMTATDFGDKVVGSVAASATSSPVPEPDAQAAASTTRPRPSPRPGWCCEPGPLLLSFLDLPASGRGPRLFGTRGSAQAAGARSVLLASAGNWGSLLPLSSARSRSSVPEPGTAGPCAPEGAPPCFLIWKRSVRVLREASFHKTSSSEGERSGGVGRDGCR